MPVKSRVVRKGFFKWYAELEIPAIDYRFDPPRITDRVAMMASEGPFLTKRRAEAVRKNLAVGQLFYQAKIGATYAKRT